MVGLNKSGLKMISPPEFTVLDVKRPSRSVLRRIQETVILLRQLADQKLFLVGGEKLWQQKQRGMKT